MKYFASISDCSPNEKFLIRKSFGELMRFIVL